MREPDLRGGSGGGTPYSPARITDVSGGRHDPVVRRTEQLAMEYASAHTLAGVYDAAGTKMRDWAGRGVRTLADGDLLQSALLAPLSFAEAEAAVVLATTGPDGIGVESVGWEADALAVRACVRLLEEVDRLDDTVIETFDYLLGRAIGSAVITALPGLLLTAGPLLVPAGVGAGVLWRLLPDSARAAARRDGIEGREGLEDWLAERPELLRHVLNGGGGLLDGLTSPGPLLPGLPGAPWPPLHPTTEDAASSLVWLRGDEGPPVVTPYTPPPHLAPTSLRELMENLSAVNGGEAAPQPEGAVSVQPVTGPDGQLRWIVYAPGTDDLNPLHHDETIRDMHTNTLLMAGESTAYGEGLVTAMREAGVGRDDPVLVVGHSQGGMQAVDLLGRDTGHQITHVVTAGSPTSQADVPADSPARVLSLEHEGDVVPLLSGEAAEPSRSHVTVRFEDSATPSDNPHGMDHYVHGAGAADASDDPGVREQVAALQGFLTGEGGPVSGYLVSRP